MRKILGKSWTNWKAWLRAQSRIGRLSVWLTGIVLSCVLLYVAHLARGLAIAISILCLIPLMPLSLILLYRWIARRVFWKVRNRLIVTYLLLGLAPIVLFGTLSGIALYLFAGQYATNSAETLLEEATLDVSDEAVSAATFGAVSASGHGAFPQHLVLLAGNTETAIVVLKNGVWQPLFAGTESPFANEAAPAWLHAPFRGLVVHGGNLYLCSEASVHQGNGTTLVFGSRQLTAASLADIAHGLGRITLFSNGVGSGDEKEETEVEGVKVTKDPPPPPPKDAPKDSDQDFDTVKGGVLPAAVSALDPPVIFTAPLTVLSWQTGKQVGTMEVVLSRPAILYERLFATSATSAMVVKAVLAGTAFGFGLLELLAVGMAIALSRTITRSVAELTRGTQEIDKGNLAHRVRSSQKDQLGDLARSFNGMAQSIGDLLEQQREKDRLLNEIAIAQEVQTTLFPSSPASMPGLEMHAVCLPAQTVGGDYYDFIFGPNGSLCLALGDISGKGISAALLMASLHSAVRAFSLDGGEGALLSPAILLDDINRHLYRSTQAARYATLFVACYDPQSRRLTYANGGHLPPLVLSTDGTVRRLDVGGPVVGLLGGMKYSEASVELAKGDLLIAFTDGITEPEKGLEEFGEARLLECVKRNAILPLPDIMAVTLETLQRWIGENEQPDDITLLLARQL